VNQSETQTNQNYILDAEKYVADARRDLAQAMDDGEQSPILTVRVQELARAEGELQAFTDWVQYADRYPSTEVLVRLAETIHDPVLLHDVRRDGYARAVSHIFRGSMHPRTSARTDRGN
jgi:hypothetical protein